MNSHQTNTNEFSIKGDEMNAERERDYSKLMLITFLCSDNGLIDSESNKKFISIQSNFQNELICPSFFATVIAVLAKALNIRHAQRTVFHSPRRNEHIFSCMNVSREEKNARIDERYL